jgi:hypothetical protein
MTMRQACRLNVAVVAVMTLALLGGWETYQGITQGTPLAWAQFDWDPDKDTKPNREAFDHLACYEVYVYNKDKDYYEDDEEKEKDYVTIYNQFAKSQDGTTYEKQYIKVGKLKLLCVPTYKEHHGDPNYYGK